MKRFRCIALSAVKHPYVPRGVASHPRFELAVVADDPDRPDWEHQRNQKFADEFGIPYVRDIGRAIAENDVQVAVISSEVGRHCDLGVRAADAGLHVVQDKPMSNRLTECDRLVEAVERNQVRFLMWNRNFLPAIIQTRETIASGAIGSPYAIHVDFFFAKDAGPPKGSRRPGEPPINWLEFQIAAHRDHSDGGLGHEPMGELEIEGIYPLAYIRMLMGVEVRRVFARTATHFHQVNVDNHVEDLATVTLEMDQNLLGTLCIGRIGAASHPNIGEIKIHILGTAGGLVVSEARPEVAVYYRGQSPTEFRHRRIDNGNDFHLMENFAQAIDTGSETILDVRASRAICAVVQSALESAQSATSVEVPPFRNLYKKTINSPLAARSIH
jgi:predicted dehydrogenase